MDYINQKYTHLCQEWSDIYEHLPTLYRYASECESVIELGVRTCISSWAFTLGLLHNNSTTRKKLLLNDITPCDINELLDASQSLPIDIEYQWINDLDLNVQENFDMTFIDTWHVYGQLKRELQKFSQITKKYIIMHDTTVDEFDSESIRCNHNIEELINQSGFSREEIVFGLGKAIDEFLIENPEWKILEKYTNNHGLTVLSR